MSIRTVLIQVLITFAWTITTAFLLASQSNFTPFYSIQFIWSVMASGCSSPKYLSDSQLLTKWNLNSSVWQTRLSPIWLQCLKFLIFTFHCFILYIFGSKAMGWLISLSSFLQNMYWTSPIYGALCLGLMTQRETGQSPCPQSLMAEANGPSQRSAINVITWWINGKGIGQEEMGRAGLAKSMPCILHFHTSTLFLSCASSCMPKETLLTLQGQPGPPPLWCHLRGAKAESVFLWTTTAFLTVPLLHLTATMNSVHAWQLSTTRSKPVVKQSHQQGSAAIGKEV